MSNKSDIKDYCKFNDDVVYVLVGMARPKENENLERSYIKRRIVTYEDKVEQKINELNALCSTKPYKFRLYITVNSRNIDNSIYNLHSKLTKMAYGKTDTNKKRMDKEWYTILQQTSSKHTNRFLIDIDDEDRENYNNVITELQKYTEIKYKTETPNGYHIVVDPFDYNKINKNNIEDVKKDGLLFIDYIN